MSADGEQIADLDLSQIDDTLNLSNQQEFRVMELSIMHETYKTIKDIVQPQKSAKFFELSGRFFYIIDYDTQLNVTECHEDGNEATLKLEMTIETEEDGLIDFHTIKTSSNIKLSEFAETFAKMKARI